MTRRNSITVCIGDIVCTIAGLSVSRNVRLQKQYQAFLCRSTATPDLGITLTPRRRTRKASSEIQVSGPAPEFKLESEEFSGRFNPVTGSGAAWVQEEPEAFDMFLRVLFSVVVPLRNALLVHACGFVRNAAAFVFAGHSETGKTTTARLLPVRQVLSDELVIVRRCADGWHAYATPFAGEFRGAIRNQQAPLTGVCFLERSGFPVRPVRSRSQMMVQWLEHTFYFCRDRLSQQRMLILAQSLSAGVPALHADIGAAKKVERIINELGHRGLAAKSVGCVADG